MVNKRSHFFHIIGPGSHLLVLQFDSHHTEGVVSSVVVDVDAAEALLAWLDGHPLLAAVIIDHHRGPGLANALFTVGGVGWGWGGLTDSLKGSYTGQGSQGHTMIWCGNTLGK